MMMSLVWVARHMWTTLILVSWSSISHAGRFIPVPRTPSTSSQAENGSASLLAESPPPVGVSEETWSKLSNLSPIVLDRVRNLSPSVIQRIANFNPGTGESTVGCSQCPDQSSSPGESIEPLINKERRRRQRRRRRKKPRQPGMSAGGGGGGPVRLRNQKESQQWRQFRQWRRKRKQRRKLRKQVLNDVLKELGIIFKHQQEELMAS